MSALAQMLAAMPDAERRKALAGLPAADLAALEYAWPVWARPDQLPPPRSFRTWLMLGGRGSGKTRSAGEWIRDQVESGRRRSIGIIGPTADTLRRDVVQGASGLLAISPPWNRPTHEASQRRVLWPCGAVAHLLSSEEPDRIRGPNLDGFWGDELTSWSNAQGCWDNLQFALRVSGPKGDAPAGVVSTTPKRHGLLRLVIADPQTVVTRSTTYDNAANLDGATIAYLTGRYGNSTLGRQELMAELLDEVDGALWTRATIDRHRVSEAPADLRVVVGIDPAGSTGRNSAETGIIAAGRAPDGHVYILRDGSGRYTPDQWARRAIDVARSVGAHYLVCETNFGGDMVEANIKNVAYTTYVKRVHASRGKMIRAEPISTLYEQGRIHHVGLLPELEDQLCGWNPLGRDPSPDRLDALVWAATELTPSNVAKVVEWRC